MKNKILNLLKEWGELSVKEISERLSISRQMVHRHLNSLLLDGSITKLGQSPKVFYTLKDQTLISEVITTLDNEVEDFIDEHFIQITENGEWLKGLIAFQFWCNKRDLPVDKTALEYKKTKEKYLSYYNNYKLIDGKSKLNNTKGFDVIHLNQLYYSDFYAIERFGKTKLGQMLLYAKQGQDRKITKEIIQNIKLPLQELIHAKKIDAIGYIPPSVRREVQFMSELKKYLAFKLPVISIEKVLTDVIVPQKTLSKLKDRIINARTNIVVTERRTFNTILLIDDAVGSGATINETAAKVLKRKVANNIIGYAVTGSFKGFDVLSEA